MHRPASAPDEPRTNTWSVYVLRCRDGALYTGITNDLPRRLATHNAGRGARFTRGRLPVELAWSLDKLDPTHARRLEYAIKQLTRAQKLCLLDGTLLPRLEEDRWTLAPPPTARTRTRRTRTATATATATSTRTGMRTRTGTGTGTSTRTGTRTREG